MKGEQEKTLEFYCVARSVRMLSEVKCWRSPARSLPIRNLTPVYVLSKDEGGRHTPVFKGYRPQFYFRTTDVTGSVELPEGVEMVMPGDDINMVAELICPIAMDEGLRFAIREGGRTVEAGVVTKVIE